MCWLKTYLLVTSDRMQKGSHSLWLNAIKNTFSKLFSCFASVIILLYILFVKCRFRIFISKFLSTLPVKRQYFGWIILHSGFIINSVKCVFGQQVKSSSLIMSQQILLEVEGKDASGGNLLCWTCRSATWMSILAALQLI